MTKLLMMVSGLVAISASSLPVLTKSEGVATKKEEIVSALVTNQQWEITSTKEIREVVKPDEWLYFAIDNINLSSMGITDIDKLHKYNTIEVPDFFIRFFGKTYIDIKGDNWDAKRSLGSENWSYVYWKIIDNVTMKLERASTIWVNESNELMMRLAYHASLQVVWSPENPVGGLITFRSGSFVNFY